MGVFEEGCLEVENIVVAFVVEERIVCRAGYRGRGGRGFVSLEWLLQRTLATFKFVKWKTYVRSLRSTLPESCFEPASASRILLCIYQLDPAWKVCCERVDFFGVSLRAFQRSIRKKRSLTFYQDNSRSFKPLTCTLLMILAKTASTVSSSRCKECKLSATAFCKGPR